jgi:hypothetical protein
VSGNTLTVTDMNQSSFTVTVNSSTQIVESNQASASSLQVGSRVSVVGLRNAQGELQVRLVTVLSSGA